MVRGVGGGEERTRRGNVLEDMSGRGDSECLVGEDKDNVDDVL